MTSSKYQWYLSETKVDSLGTTGDVDYYVHEDVQQDFTRHAPLRGWKVAAAKPPRGKAPLPYLQVHEQAS